MRTIPVLNANQLQIYHAHLQSDHDYQVWADILNINGVLVGTVELLDGQVNGDTGGDGPDRTASIVLSDPDGALEYGTNYTTDDKNVIWMNRLVRIRHRTYVPKLGMNVTATVFVGSPTAVSRKGAELGLELADKSVLSDHGVRARTFKKGMNVRNALVRCLRDTTGERHFRIPTTKKTLSKSYTTGMGQDIVTPWQLFKKIAAAEMGWRAYYSADGYATCEPTSTTKHVLRVDSLLTLPETSTSFTEFVNYVSVTSKRKPVIKKKMTKAVKKKLKATTITMTGVAVLPTSHRLSERSLARNGVSRTLPLVIHNNNLKSVAQVNSFAISSLKTGSGLQDEASYEIIPFFHLDPYDKITLPLSIGAVWNHKVSIPLGVGGNMTLGGTRWVSRPVVVKRTSSKRTVTRKKSKGGSKSTSGIQQGIL